MLALSLRAHPTATSNLPSTQLCNLVDSIIWLVRQDVLKLFLKQFVVSFSLSLSLSLSLSFSLSPSLLLIASRKDHAPRRW